RTVWCANSEYWQNGKRKAKLRQHEQRTSNEEVVSKVTDTTSFFVSLMHNPQHPTNHRKASC
ncbi:MAG: hypothetical protein U0K35_10015, partial [Prevotella sp.]|nr:hypothetical protein [Prevotella sp.]